MHVKIQKYFDGELFATIESFVEGPLALHKLLVQVGFEQSLDACINDFSIRNTTYRMDLGLATRDVAH